MSRAEYLRGWRAANRDKVRTYNARYAAAQREWKRAHPEARAAYNRHERERRAAAKPAERVERLPRDSPPPCTFCTEGPCSGQCERVSP